MSIDHPESLTLVAIEELEKPAGNRRFEHQVNGVAVRHYTACVAFFDASWRALFKQGIIRTRLVGRRTDGGILQLRDEPDPDEQPVLRSR